MGGEGVNVVCILIGSCHVTRILIGSRAHNQSFLGAHYSDYIYDLGTNEVFACQDLHLKANEDVWL